MFLHPSTIQLVGMLSLSIISSILQPWLGIGIEGDAAGIGTSSIRHLNPPPSKLVSDSVPLIQYWAGSGMSIL
jgi:hypothetical protein